LLLTGKLFAAEVLVARETAKMRPSEH